MPHKWKIFFGITLLSTSLSFAESYTVNAGTDANIGTGGAGTGTSGELRYVLNQILNNQAKNIVPGPHTIQFTVPTVAFNNILPMINLFRPDTITIGNLSGTPTTIDGNSAGRPFFIKDGA